MLMNENSYLVGKKKVKRQSSVALLVILALLGIHFAPTSAHAHNAWAKLRPYEVCLKQIRLANKQKRPAKIQHCRFFKANLAGRNLSRANAHHSFFNQANLAGVTFSSANLRKASFGFSTNAVGANFIGANLRGMEVRNFDYLEKCDPCFEAADFSYADLRGAYFGSDGMPLQDGISGHVVLRNARFYGARLNGANFWLANLEGADLENANADGGDFTGVQFQSVNLKHASFISADFDGAVLHSSSEYFGADFTGVDFSNTTFGTGITLSNVVMTDANFDGNNLVRVDFTNAKLDRASFSWVSLVDADFSGASLRGAFFNSALLHNTDFRGADLCGAEFISDEYGSLGNNALLGEGVAVLGDTIMPDCTVFE
jgi:uncharacterized protein YjbI with pentapeptide repeats